MYFTFAIEQASPRCMLVEDALVASECLVGGFTQTDAALGGKWLSLLKEAVPRLKRAGLMFNPETAPGQGKFFMTSIEAAANSLAVEPVVLPVHSDTEIEAGIAVLGREGGGLVMTDDSFMAVHYRTAIFAAARHNVPAISFTAQFEEWRFDVLCN